MKQNDSSDLLLNRRSESLSEDISDGDGVTGGHLFGVRALGRMGGLSMAGKLSSLSISATTNKASANKKWQQLTIH